MKLFVEGGGDTAALRTECRGAFTSFMKRAGLPMLPRVVACGSRREAYDDFCTAVDRGEAAMLLVDSEECVDSSHQEGEISKWRPWSHLKLRHGDNWDRPSAAEDADCHLMAPVMEAWFLADRKALAAYFGQGFNGSLLPPDTRDVERLAKGEIYRALEKATAACKVKAKATYKKGDHSFKILASIDSTEVTKRSPWARRLVEELKHRMTK